MTTTVLYESPWNSWAEVELYRWQHGHLPGESGTEELPLSVPEGLRGMAVALEKGDRKNNFPNPINVATVLRYVADNIEKQTSVEK